MIENQEIIDKLISGENYYNLLITNNRSSMSVGLPTRYLNKIDSLFYVNKALRFRIDKSVFDATSTKLYYKIIKLLPIEIV